MIKPSERKLENILALDSHHKRMETFGSFNFTMESFKGSPGRQEYICGNGDRSSRGIGSGSNSGTRFQETKGFGGGIGCGWCFFNGNGSKL